MKHTALITGGASGLGRRTAEFLINQGWTVFAADINQTALQDLPSPILPVILDVTDPASIADAVQEVERHTDGLDGIVNCAGILVVGSVIEVPESDLLHILDVSLLGTYRINKAFFHLVLRRRGRIVNLSSEIGWQTAAPFNGPYAMAKHALEAYSDALRRELMFLGIKVIKIQPGSFHTNLVAGVEAAFERAIASAPYLGDILRRNMYLAVAELAKSHDPVLVARVIHKALTTPHPKIAYSIKPDPLRSFLDRLPTPLLDFLIYRALKR